MTVVVNGTEVELAETALVSDVVASLRPNQEARGVAVAVNGTVVPRGEWPVTRLASGDKVEVLTAVAGG